MDTLFDALYDYAMEYRVDGFLKPEEKELKDNQWMRDNALSALKAMNAQTAGWAERLEYGQDALLDLHRRAGFLAGLSMGLELSRV